MSSVKAKPAQGALWKKVKNLNSSPTQQLCGRGAHRNARSQEATPELHIPAAVRETPEENQVCAALCALDMQSREFVIPKTLAFRRNL